ncbi:MAG TPA: hypothetical protein VF175_11065, partial [Lacipirellula sp.]
MSDPLTNDEHRLEEIVAYLDGELPAEESARVERQLASDESYRRQLQGVERAWKALDELPRMTVGDQFSRTTMALTVEAARAEVHERTSALPVQKRRGRLAAWFTAAVAALLGFLVVRIALRQPERMLLADLPVIDNVDVYSQIDDPDFLRRLQSEFGPALAELGGKPDDPPAGVARLDATTPGDGREDWLQGLDALERTNLRAKYNRFRELPEREQQRQRALHDQITSSPDSAELQRTMFVYHEWLRGLSPARQFELRGMPPDERVQAVARWAEELRDDALFTLSEEELREFFRQMRGPFNDLVRSAAREAFTSPDRRRPGRAGEPIVNLQRALIRQFTAGMAQRGEFQTSLLEALPARTREPFEQLPPRDKVERVMAWRRQAEALQGQVSEQELERFFAEELDPETRAELLSLPPGEMQQSLRR